ncbi:MAG: cell division protein ZapA [Spirochaetia bacterium]|nr:cell division protein ZapA [Spirochaetia bacterium]
MSKDVFVVRIFDQEYKVKLGEHDPGHITRLAGHVDAKIREIHAHFPNMEFSKLLMLVCMNLADELFKAREAGEAGGRTEEEARAMLLGLKALIDGAVSKDEPRT